MDLGKQHAIKGSSQSLDSTEGIRKTDKWLFFDECVADKWRQRPKLPRFEDEWREKYDVYGKPFRAIMANRPKPCLPKIPLPAITKTPAAKKKNQIYSRYTPAKHRRKDAGKEVIDMVNTPDGLFNQIKGAFGDDRISVLKKTLLQVDHDEESSLQEQQQALEDLMKVMSGKAKGHHKLSVEENYLFEDAPDTSEENEARRNVKTKEDLMAIFAVRKNMYIYHAKTPKHSRDKTRQRHKLEDTPAVWDSPEEIRLKKEVRDFCDWILELGGDEDNLDELTLNCLFASGYDTSPCLSAPIAILKPSEIPDALREASVVPPPQKHQPASSVTTNNLIPSEDKTYIPDIDENNRHMYRYGAWYLKPDTWKRMRKDVKIVDPEEIEMEENMSEMEAKRRAMAEELSSIYITKAFGDFLKVKKCRVPEFIDQAERLREEMQRKEIEKLEEELLKAKKKSRLKAYNNKVKASRK